MIFRLRTKNRFAVSMLISMLLPSVASGTASASRSTVASSNSDADHSSTTAYRVRVEVRESGKLPDVKLPPATKSWEIEYEYQVPPLPSSATWNYKSQVIYQWGDIDFDAYGSRGAYKLSSYLFNQIVPQLFIGNVLSGNGAHYDPRWSKLSTWAIQAQYYWQRGDRSYAQTGNIVNVSPGDEITTIINYRGDTGEIIATVSDNRLSRLSGQSKITIKSPFPNEPSLFSSWKDFFRRAETKSHHNFILGHPALDVETYHLDKKTMCGLLPLIVESISIPRVPLTASQFETDSVGGFACSRPLAGLSFNR